MCSKRRLYFINYCTAACDKITKINNDNNNNNNDNNNLLKFYISCS